MKKKVEHCTEKKTDIMRAQRVEITSNYNGNTFTDIQLKSFLICTIIVSLKPDYKTIFGRQRFSCGLSAVSSG